MNSYTLRDIDPDLWKQVKVKAAQEGKTVKAVLEDLLKAYAR